MRYCCNVIILLRLQVISLGDTIKFSLSPLKTKDRLSTNVPGVPLDDKNLVRNKLSVNICRIFLCFLSCKAYALLFLQIIKALNLYRKKTGSDNFFWVKSNAD